jgi:hypothetical protein
MDCAIPFNKPFADNIEQRYVAQALSSPKHSGDGPFICNASIGGLLLMAGPDAGKYILGTDSKL